MARKLFTNARVVSPDEVFLGTVEWHAGRIVRVEIGATSVPGAEDLAGDYLLPGLVKLGGVRATALPRGTAGIASLVETDLIAAACGITTVFDIFDLPAHADASAWAAVAASLAWLDVGTARGTLRCHHAVRWQVTPASAANLPAAFAMLPRHRLARLVSVAPETLATFDGVADIAREHGLTAATINVSSPADVALCRSRGIDRLLLPAASAGDCADLAALRCMPNHPTSVTALPRSPPHLGPRDALDTLGPTLELLQGPFRGRDHDRWSLALGIAAVSVRAARLAGFQDRGAIAVGQRADLVRVRESDGVAVPISTWRGGERIA